MNTRTADRQSIDFIFRLLHLLYMSNVFHPQLWDRAQIISEQCTHTYTHIHTHTHNNDGVQTLSSQNWSSGWGWRKLNRKHRWFLWFTTTARANKGCEEEKIGQHTRAPWRWWRFHTITRTRCRLYNGTRWYKFASVTLKRWADEQTQKTHANAGRNRWKSNARKTRDIKTN